MRQIWNRVRQSHVPDGAWADYHENSKTTRHVFTAPRGDAEAKAWMEAIDRRPFLDQKTLELPPRSRLDTPLETVLKRRRSVREFHPRPLSSTCIASLLHATYGVTHAIDEKLELRTVPSAGAMYPLDIVLALGASNEIPAGIYDYIPHSATLHQMYTGDRIADVAHCMVEPQLAESSSAIVLFGAMFERTIYKYGERGYRFTLLEAGHAAQNLLLACEASGLAALPYGGFIDRELDELLGFDGVTMSCVYAVIIGGAHGPEHS